MLPLITFYNLICFSNTKHVLIRNFLPPYITNSDIFSIIKFELMPRLWQNFPNFVSGSGFSLVPTSVAIVSFSSPILVFYFILEFYNHKLYFEIILLYRRYRINMTSFYLFLSNSITTTILCVRALFLMFLFFLFLHKKQFQINYFA